MDEFSRGMEPEVKRYFRKILNSFSIVSVWLLTAATAGFFFKLAIIRGSLRWYNILFYVAFIASLILLLSYLYRIWTKKG
jgi:hypothetical protein